VPCPRQCKHTQVEGLLAKRNRLLRVQHLRIHCTHARDEGQGVCEVSCNREQRHTARSVMSAGYESECVAVHGGEGVAEGGS